MSMDYFAALKAIKIAEKVKAEIIWKHITAMQDELIHIDREIARLNDVIFAVGGLEEGRE